MEIQFMGLSTFILVTSILSNTLLIKIYRRLWLHGNVRRAGPAWSVLHGCPANPQIARRLLASPRRTADEAIINSSVLCTQKLYDDGLQQYSWEDRSYCDQCKNSKSLTCVQYLSRTSRVRNGKQQENGFSRVSVIAKLVALFGKSYFRSTLLISIKYH